MRLLWIFTLAFAFLLVFQNVNADRKGSGNKGVTHDGEHHHHPNANTASALSSLKNRHSGSSGHSSSSHHDGKHKSKKHRKNKHHKHRDGKKHHKHRDGNKHHSSDKNHHHH